jgi:hypothetical protein
MATIAEIAQNPARPVKAIEQLLDRGLSDAQVANEINSAISATGRKLGKKPLTAGIVAFYRKRFHPTGRTVSRKTKSGAVKTRTLSPEYIMAKRASNTTRRHQQRGATMDQIKQYFTPIKAAGGGPRTSITGAQKANYQTMRDIYAELRSLKGKLGQKLTRTIKKGKRAGTSYELYGGKLAKYDKYLALPQVGAYANRRRGGMVAMNPSFGNPSFDFSKETIIENVTTGGQTALGVVFGVAAAKYGNDLIVEKIMQSVFKKAPSDKVSIWQRLGTAALTGIVVPGLARSFLGGRPWVDRVADGMIAGSALYVLGGIEYQGKPVINIGEMVGGVGEDIVIDRNVNYAVQHNVQTEVGGNGYSLDESIGAEAVQAYDVNPDPQYVGGDNQMDSQMGAYDTNEDGIYR